MFKKQREAKIKELKQSIRTISINRKIIYIQEVGNRKYNNLLKKILKFSLENSLQRVNSVSEQAESISELTDKSRDYPVKEQKGKKKNEQNIRDLWNIMKYTKTCTSITKGKLRKRKNI